MGVNGDTGSEYQYSISYRYCTYLYIERVIALGQTGGPSTSIPPVSHTYMTPGSYTIVQQLTSNADPTKTASMTSSMTVS